MCVETIYNKMCMMRSFFSKEQEEYVGRMYTGAVGCGN